MQTLIQMLHQEYSCSAYLFCLWVELEKYSVQLQYWWQLSSCIAQCTSLWLGEKQFGSDTSTIKFPLILVCRELCPLIFCNSLFCSFHDHDKDKLHSLNKSFLFNLNCTNQRVYELQMSFSITTNCCTLHSCTSCILLN